MGVMYSVFPFGAKVRSALADYNLVDEGWPEGRNPKPIEIREVIDQLPGIRAEYQIPSQEHGWSVFVEDSVSPEEGPWTQLRTLTYSGEAQPTEIYFEKGWPDLIVRIVAELAKACGTLCVVPDTGEAPLIVPVGANPEHLLAAWEHTSPPQDEAEDQQ